MVTPYPPPPCLSACMPTPLKAGAADALRTSARFEVQVRKLHKTVPLSTSMATSNTKEAAIKDADRRANFMLCWAEA